MIKICETAAAKPVRTDATEIVTRLGAAIEAMTAAEGTAFEGQWTERVATLECGLAGALANSYTAAIGKALLAVGAIAQIADSTTDPYHAELAERAGQSLRTLVAWLEPAAGTTRQALGLDYYLPSEEPRTAVRRRRKRAVA